MAGTLNVLIIGGYGTFGRRLARLLKREPALTLFIAGRSERKASAFADSLNGVAAVRPVRFDRSADLNLQFAVLKPDIVVDASGPFQDYDEERHRVAEAAIDARSHYLDLADDRSFVLGVALLDEQARSAGRFAISGASTCPALTSAVYRHLVRDFRRVESVVGGIAPSPRAGVGLNVVRAVASSAGRAISVRRNGGDDRAYAFVDSRRQVITVPGATPLRPLRFSLADVPDLSLLGRLAPTPDTVWFGAAPGPPVYHFLFRLLARGVRAGLLRSLLPLAKPMSFVRNRLSWGEHRGGMIVECRGTGAQGQHLSRSWHLIAEGDDGPNVPVLAACAIIRKVIRGEPPASGARPAHRDLELSDFEPMFADLRLIIGERESPLPSEWPLFRRLLGSAWSLLPDILADTHNLGDSRCFEGRASVRRGRSPFARVAAALFRLPKSGDDVPLLVSMTARDGEERWERNFDGRRFSSRLSAGRGSWAGLIRERFGPFSFGMALVVDDGRLRFVMRRWAIAGIPLPHLLLPRGVTHESVQNGRFHFHVEIAFPILGHFVTYRGWLTPVRSSTAPEPHGNRE